MDFLNTKQKQEMTDQNQIMIQSRSTAEGNDRHGCNSERTSSTMNTQQQQQYNNGNSTGSSSSQLSLIAEEKVMHVQPSTPDLSIVFSSSLSDIVTNQTATTGSCTSIAPTHSRSSTATTLQTEHDDDLLEMKGSSVIGNGSSTINSTPASSSLLPPIPFAPRLAPRKRSLLKVAERIRDNRQRHIERMKHYKEHNIKRRLLEDYYCVETIFPAPPQQPPFETIRRPSSSDITAITTSTTTTQTPPTGNKLHRFISSVGDKTRVLVRRKKDSSSTSSTTSTSPTHRSVPAQPKPRIVVLPGVPKYEEDWARDCHDFFNLVVLVPLVALDVMNWNWETMLFGFSKLFYQYKLFYQTYNYSGALAKLVQYVFRSAPAVVIASSKHYHNPKEPIQLATILQNSWTGDWFESFFAITAGYFLIDLIWVYAVPQAVRSPSTIIQHHIATLLYIIIPYYYPDCRWCMGACMIVEVNTWFLIARRVFNKQGFPPWTIIDFSFFSIRIKFISVMFYITWISIRCILYPSLIVPFYTIWVNHSQRVGNKINIVGLCIPLHTIFCLLNLKWTYELLMSKIRYWKRLRTLRKKGITNADMNHVSKGL